MPDPIPGIVWPSLTGDTADILAKLRTTEVLSRTEIKTGQLHQLQALAAHTKEQTVWGRQHLPEHLTWESFAALPVLSRAFVQSHEHELTATRFPPEHGAAQQVVTSGSTGTPVRVWKSLLAGAIWQAVTARDHLWQQRDLTLTMSAIRRMPAAPYPGLTVASWGQAAQLLGGTGPSHVLDISTPAPQQIDWLDAHSDIAYLVTFPSNLAELLRLCEAQGLCAAQGKRWPALREVRTLSEPVADELRARCHEVLGVEIVDQYSTQELGYLALQRPDGPGLYAMSDTHIVEVLTEDGQHCVPGEIGRVVVTPLHNFAMPLFRYDVGDLALVGEPGPMPYLVIDKIFGRTRNLLMAPDGTRRWPNLGSRGLVKIAGVLQHQFVQVTAALIDVKLVVPQPPSEDQEQAMRALLAERTPAGIEFTFSYVDHIPRGPGGKFEEFICAVPS